MLWFAYAENIILNKNLNMTLTVSWIYISSKKDIASSILRDFKLNIIPCHIFYNKYSLHILLL